MEELKRRIKTIVPADKLDHVDEIFSEWIASLKVHTIPQQPEAAAGRSREGQRSDSPDPEVEELKRQIEGFKDKLRKYKASTASSADVALAEVKQEIGKIREEISRLRLKFAAEEKEAPCSENAELIQKLDEVKQFLEKLK